MINLLVFFRCCLLFLILLVKLRYTDALEDLDPDQVARL